MPTFFTFLAEVGILEFHFLLIFVKTQFELRITFEKVFFQLKWLFEDTHKNLKIINDEINELMYSFHFKLMYNIKLILSRRKLV